MNCEQIDAEIDQRLESGVAALSATVQAHLTACGRCRSLYGEPGVETPDYGSSAFNRRILASMAPSLAAIAPVPRFSICVFRSFGLLAILAAVPVAFMGLPALARMNIPQLLTAVMLLAVAALLGSVLLAKQIVPATRQWLATWPGTALFAGIVLIVNIAVFPWREQGTSFVLSWACLFKELAIAAPGGFIFWITLRRAALLSAVAKGASIGAMAGLLGVIVLQFGCIHQQAAHLLLWHWSAIAVTAGTGALVGRFFSEHSQVTRNQCVGSGEGVVEERLIDHWILSTWRKRK
jgi:hypothetical protein